MVTLRPISLLAQSGIVAGFAGLPESRATKLPIMDKGYVRSPCGLARAGAPTIWAAPLGSRADCTSEPLVAFGVAPNLGAHPSRLIYFAFDEARSPLLGGRAAKTCVHDVYTGLDQKFHPVFGFHLPRLFTKMRMASQQSHFRLSFFKIGLILPVFKNSIILRLC